MLSIRQICAPGSNLHRQGAELEQKIWSPIKR
jgi:hypothetical protein